MSNLTDLVGGRAEADDTLSDDATLLVWAALEGDDALADIDGFIAESAGPAPVTTSEATGAFIREIAVRGFRGIGARATLSLKPGPGLTVIAGRNGSGKSSFAEALELALTGDSYRWRSKRSTQWKDTWRNLHDGDDPHIKVTLSEEDERGTYVEVSWPANGELDAMQPTVQRHGKPRAVGLGSLGWANGVDIYRPLLTYDELGVLLSAEPSKLYDALSVVLGLDELRDALARLTQLSKALDEPGRALAAQKKSVLADLADLDDQRAVSAAKLVRAHKTDPAAIRSLATGVDSEDTDLSSLLTAVLALSVPTDEELVQAHDDLVDAVGALAAAAGTALSPLERRMTTISAAVASHEHDGDAPCPVCGLGVLDTARVAVLRRELTDARESLAGLRAARNARDESARRARALILGVPAPLTAQLGPELADLRTTVVDAWREWARPVDDPLAMADHLLHGAEPLADALTALQEASAPLLDARDDAWARVATQLAAFGDATESWAEQQPRAKAAKEAVTWLKDNDQLLKNERLQPVAEQASAIWADLRQESNVEISGLSLNGTNPRRRRLEIESSVDGVDAGGLSVLSQGELHALALALFLPRATLPESPFRFIVLDDPVQAMDPAKVDGLLTVLSRLARTRQVVVFSHDDRLAAAVRRGAAEATILQVTRGGQSVVTVHGDLDPATRYWRDAEAMARDAKLPVDTKRRRVPSMLRMAVETVARDRYFSGRIGLGSSLAALEDTWSRTHQTARKVALAVFDDAARTSHLGSDNGTSAAAPWGSAPRISPRAVQRPRERLRRRAPSPARHQERCEVSALLAQAAEVFDGRIRVPSESLRGACWLARTAREDGLRDRLTRAGYDMGTANMRSVLACHEQAAREFGAQSPTAGTPSATYAWTALSHACHHHAYELAPMVSEVKHLLRLVVEVLAARPLPQLG